MPALALINLGWQSLSRRHFLGLAPLSSNVSLTPASKTVLADQHTVRETRRRSQAGVVAAVLVPMSLWRAALVLFHIEDSSPCILQARRKDVRKEGGRGQWGIHKRVFAVLLLSFFTSQLPSLCLRAVPYETTRPPAPHPLGTRQTFHTKLFGVESGDATRCAPQRREPA